MAGERSFGSGWALPPRIALSGTMVAGMVPGEPSASTERRVGRYDAAGLASDRVRRADGGTAELLSALRSAMDPRRPILRPLRPGRHRRHVIAADTADALATSAVPLGSAAARWGLGSCRPARLRMGMRLPSRGRRDRRPDTAGSLPALTDRSRIEGAGYDPTCRPAIRVMAHRFTDRTAVPWGGAIPVVARSGRSSGAARRAPAGYSRDTGPAWHCPRGAAA